MSYPIIIQGGMGVGVSHWPLARAVSRLSQLGVVSGTALDVVLARRLQGGDPDGHLRRALAHFPLPGVADRILKAYFVPGGKPAGQPFKSVPMNSAEPPRALVELIVAANFAEVFLAKEGHAGVVGINFLQKVQLPTLPSLYGALLAGVDYVLMGAGIPLAIPGVLDQLARGETTRLRLEVEGALPDEQFHATFDPADFWGAPAPSLQRPRFLAIIASAVLALTLARKASGRVAWSKVRRLSAELRATHPPQRRHHPLRAPGPAGSWVAQGQLPGDRALPQRWRAGRRSAAGARPCVAG